MIFLKCSIAICIKYWSLRMRNEQSKKKCLFRAGEYMQHCYQHYHDVYPEHCSDSETIAILNFQTIAIKHKVSPPDIFSR